LRGWEKQLHQIFDETNADKLSKMADEALAKYFDSLPAPGVPPGRYGEGESPLDHLLHAAHCYATAIKVKAKDAALHLRLGMILEEQFFVENVVGFKGEKVSITMIFILFQIMDR
jgi:hypothetical protein